MALQTSGQISLNDVNVELGNSGSAQIDMNSAAVRGLFDVASGQIRMSDGYGKANATVLTSAGTVNGQDQRQEITISDFISSGETLLIPSNIWVWSATNGTAALIIDIPCTLINEGKIIGKGGDNGTPPYSGSDAISITSTGVTITNNSGAYIAGGGGAGAVGGGGGAGGGQGRGQVAGGTLNATGANGANPYGGNSGQGGGAGGGAQGIQTDSHYGWMQGGGGGRILPGVGGAAGVGYGGAGGSAGNPGANATGYFTANGSVYPAGTQLYAGGGGGGWGARGGTSTYPHSDWGVGGAAIAKTNTYTLTNNGTIYGAT